MPWILPLCHSGLLGLVLHTVTPVPAAATSLSGRILDQGLPVRNAVVTLELLAAPRPFPRLSTPDTDLDWLPRLRSWPEGRFFLAEEEALLPRVLVAAPGESIQLHSMPDAAVQELWLAQQFLG
jgi:hypothetical protein